ncbi:hypothetical protein M569_09625, partial [Genlisea aurea]
ICVFVFLALVELSIGESDVDALIQLKKGIFLSDNASWDPNSLAPDGCPRNWVGISCINGSVSSIQLDDLGLRGEFSFYAVSRLQMLQKLSIPGNRFAGALTKDIGSIESLRHLDLSDNMFTGTLPSQITDLKNLVLINISSNNFNGQVPSGFGGMKLLRYLDFHQNGFQGDVMSLLSKLGGLLHVDLSCNAFSGSLDLGLGNPDFITSVQYLNISGNNLTGELFPHDGMPYFDNLQVFDASDNRFFGNVPSFSFVVSLRVIRLRNNSLSGSLPQGLLRESSMVLSELDISFNQLEGPIDAISSASLRSLNLSSNRLSGRLPALIGHCGVVDLSNNMFSGNVSRIQSWGNYAEVIDLSSNLLTGSFPNQTTQFLRLASLRISNNSIEGDLPPLLLTYPDLELIDLSLNKLSGLLLPSLFNNSKLAYIDLSSNGFSGGIPYPDSAQNYSLVFLNLSHNGLTGEFPQEMGRLRRLEVVDLSENSIGGTIPDDLSETLMAFNVSYNNLSGIVPKSLEKFPSSSFHPGNDLLVFPNAVVHGGSSSSSSSHRRKLRAALTAGIVVGASLLAVIALLTFFRAQNYGSRTSLDETDVKKVVSSENQDGGLQEPSVKNNVSSPTKLENPSSLKVCAPGELAGDLHVFDGTLKLTPEELSSAAAEAVGISCHGTLYRAVISSGHVLAVKLLKQGIAKSKKEFYREAKKLCSIRHPNLVSIQGFYWGPKEHEKLVISKYVDAPCLARYLHGSDSGNKLPPLSLHDRLKIALDVARCLTYLHTESAIPHGNLKSTNILVETSGPNAVLTDYSLHRLLTSSGTADQVLNAGALGYLPPEFTSTSKRCPSLKSDVYAFGIVLLELLTGRSSANMVSGDLQVVDLAEWVSSSAAENRAVDCFDPGLVGPERGVPKGVESMLQIALKCIHSAAERPDMRMVFEELCCV